MADLFERASDCARFILGRTAHRPRIGLILGSGLGAFAESMSGADEIPYGDIPGFHKTTVVGHAGKLVIGDVGGVSVVVMSGRFHFYEGHGMDVVTFPVRVMRQMGVRYLFVTNSAGGINAGFGVGSLMVITDHLNLTGQNPLVGANLADFGPRFPDMSYAYDPDLRAELEGAAGELGCPVVHGVYASLPGPSYETPAEIRMLRTMGADAVGMSTVPEVIVANHAGMRAAGVSCISNMAAGMTLEKLSHDEVKEAANMVSANFVGLLTKTVARMAASDEYDWSTPDWAVES